MGRISGGGGGGEGHAEAESGGIEDCSPGTIVWVRRRNGSWWPGRILGPDELPASQIMSPRTGTPVKLLGREDASVDWYNLEKSKRVKAFRCGEFDACIDRAKSSEGTPVKRREKYARREDAILHALELERKQLALKYQNQGLGVDDTCIIPFGDTRKEFDSFSSEYYSKNNRQEPQLPLQRIATQQCKDLSSTRYKSKKNKKRKVDSSLLLSKTKEYEQKFLHAGSKRNLPGSLAWEASENTHDNHMNGSPRSGHMQGGSTVESSEKNIALKKKRTEESAFEESLVKKHDRFRPLSQVAQSSLKLPHPFQHNTNSATVLIEGGKDPTPAMDQAKRSESTYMSTDSADAYYHGDMSCAQIISTEGHFETQTSIKEPAYLSGVHTFSGFVDKHGSDYSDRECSETETEDDAQLLHSYAKRQSPESDACDPYSLQASNKLRYVNDNDDADDEVTFSTCNTQQNVVEDEDGSSELGISQWHMKGKRNQRSAAKRPIGKTDGNISLDRSPFGKTDGNLSLDKFNSLMKGSLYRANEGSPKVESIGVSSQQSIDQTFYQTQEEWGCDSDETDLVDNVASHLEANRYFGEEHLLSSKLTRDIGRSYTSFNDAKNSCKTSPINKNVDQISSLGRKAYGEGSSLYQRNYGSHHSYMGSMLFNVDLKVQTGYQGEHVPLVCLMSRLNGKAIVGHPVQIEILEDGSTEHLDLGSNIVVEHSTITPPAWRTGRRTAMPRVPNSYSTRATLDDNDDGGLWEMKPPYNRFSVPFDQQARLAKKNISSVRRPSSHQKKPSNTKKGSSSSQKLRALSSISIGKKHHREGGQAKAHRCRDILGGLIKSEGVIPLVTCVPAKVVFSRIMEAVGRPSLAVAHRVRMTSPAVRDLP